MFNCPVRKKDIFFFCRNLSIILLDYIFNSCFALTGIVRVRLILGGGLGEQFCLCRGCTGIHIGEGVFSDCGGTRPYFWVFG